MSGSLTSIDWRHGKGVGTDNAKIIVNAEPTTLFEGLAQLITDHVPNCQVAIWPQIMGSDRSEPQVRLLLLHSRSVSDVSRNIATYRNRFPNAAIGLLVDGAHNDAGWRFLTESSIVQGYLPLNLRLEVWLAAVSLLLSGGQFYPVLDRSSAGGAPELGRTVSHAVAPPRDDAAERDLDGNGGQDGAVLPELTSRERQILALVAEGLQNKIIAHRMHLSQHTVKVHVHNVFSKLRVTNRTQAAAAFHDSTYGNRHKAHRLPGP